MKYLFIILLSLSNLALFSQSIEVMGGLTRNVLFDKHNNSGHYSSSYTSESGYSFGIGIEDVKVDWLTLRFTLSYDKYGGKLKASDGSMAGGYTTNADIDKSIISAGIYPFNFKLFKKLDLNLGFEYARLISESFSGVRYGWMIGEPDWSANLEDSYDKYSATNYFGLRVRLAYDINITEEIIVSPQYSFYRGFSSEFIEFPRETRSNRHYFCIGIQKKLK